MKRFFFIFLSITLFYWGASSAFSASPTPSPLPTNKNPIATDTADIDRIQKIKEMVAKRVSELKLVEKRGILGTVKSTSSTQITIDDNKGAQRSIDIDELTKFSGGSSEKSFGISDIKSGDMLSFIGLYNKDTKRLLARFVARVRSLPAYFEGVVTDKDKVNFTISALDSAGNKKIIDIQTSTKIQSFTKEGGLEKSGFSKIQSGQRIFAAGFWDLKEKDTLNTARLIMLPAIPPSADMKRFIPSQEAPVSTGSGRNVTPLIR